jgi:nicotinate-nucleotide adenylyltransferase
MRIGLLGGTFDPIHNGHLAIAEQAYKQLALDKVIFMPASVSPHKVPDRSSDAEDRFRMIELAIKGRPGFEVSGYEIDKKGISYSVDTLQHLKATHPEETEFFFLLGSDSLAELDTWKDRDRLFKLCKFIVFNRRGFSPDSKFPNVERLEIEPIDISSTGIRKKIREEEEITGLVPEIVEEYIKAKNLYK